jgi:hypothetical protein
MSSDIEEFLDEVDQWKLKVHEQLKGLSPKQRREFWARVGERARKLGLRVVEAEKPAKEPKKRARRTASGYAAPCIA